MSCTMRGEGLHSPEKSQASDQIAKSSPGSFAGSISADPDNSQEDSAGSHIELMGPIMLIIWSKRFGFAERLTSIFYRSGGFDGRV